MGYWAPCLQRLSYWFLGRWHHVKELLGYIGTVAAAMIGPPPQHFSKHSIAASQVNGRILFQCDKCLQV